MSCCSDVAITMFQEDYDRMVEQAKAGVEWEKYCSPRVQLREVVF